MAEVKRCVGCERDLPLGDFSPAAAGGQGRRSRCRPCYNAQQNASRAAALVTEDAALVAEVRQHGDALGSFGAEYQREAARTLARLGSVEAAAGDLGITPGRLRAHLSELRRRAAARGWAPASDMTKAVPDGFAVKGVSTFYGPEGEVRGQWVKTQKERGGEYEQLLEAMSTIGDAWAVVADPAPTPSTILDEDLLCVYPMGDPHLGMYAWHQESGQDFDLRIAERDLCAAVDHLVDLAPPAKTALIINLGDFFHADNSRGETSAGTRLDVDGRWSKVLSVGLRAMRRNIDRALEKHEMVHVISEIGNHDNHSAIMLALCLAQYYEREPRVRIDTSPDNVHWFRFGKVLIASTHGDLIKQDRLLGVMANDRARDWGETEHRYFYLGHVHHDSVKEYQGMTAETFRTLAAKDKWHASNGYRSGRDMKLDVIHREHGRICRHVVGINRLSNPKE